MTLFEKIAAAVIGGAVAVKGASKLLDRDKKSNETTAPTTGTTETTTTVETASEVKSETPTDEKTEQ